MGRKSFEIDIETSFTTVTSYTVSAIDKSHATQLARHEALEKAEKYKPAMDNYMLRTKILNVEEIDNGYNEKSI